MGARLANEVRWCVLRGDSFRNGTSAHRHCSGAEVHRSFRIDNAHPKAKLELFRNAARFITVSGLQLGDCKQLSPLDEFIDAAMARYDRHETRAEPVGNALTATMTI